MSLLDLLRRWVLCALLALSLLLPASARDVTEGEKGALAETIASFDAAMRSGDMARLMDTIPPSILDAMATQNNLTIEQLRAMMAQQMRDAMQSVLLVSFGMDVGEARYAELADGMPYALIPTETVMEIPGSGKIKAVSETLGLIEAGAWYLLRVDPTQLPLLIQIYPGFADVEFAPGTMEAVE
jgi:hypothetical protein